MATWRVGPEFIHLRPHPGADNLQLATVGEYQIVVGKNNDYKDGDIVYFAPDRSVLPDDLKGEYVNTATGGSYLTGQNQDRVKRVRLRGEYSEGVTIPSAWVIARLGEEAAPLWEDDWSERLGITKYEPPIPASLQGVVGVFRGVINGFGGGGHLRQHDVETFRMYERELVEGEAVLATEKIHGCVIKATRVRMADGNSTKTINKVVPGDYVLGMDGDGLLVSSKVLGVQKGSKTEDWLRVTIDPQKCGSGSSYFTVTCTPNHPFWVPAENRYVPAGELQAGMSALRLNYGTGLSLLQEQVLLGKMLGDGSLHVNEDAVSARLTFGHVEKHREYVEWTKRALGSLASSKISKVTSGYGSSMLQSRTSMSAHIHALLHDFAQDHARHIPESAIESVGPIALAFWYMDDGSLAHAAGQEDRALFAICRYDAESAAVAVRIFAKFGIGATLYQAEGYNRIRLNKRDAEKLFLLIAPYMPACMKYKLPERYRNSPSWLPDDSSYAPASGVYSILSVEKETPADTHRWDIQTETGNFFANGVLVHNSQISIFRDADGGRWVTSKGHAKRQSVILDAPENTYWQAARNTSIFDILDSTESLRGRNVQLWGEVFPVQKGFTYGATDATIRVFRVAVDGLDWGAEVVWKCIPPLVQLWAPVLYQGPYTQDAMVALAKGKEGVSGKELHIKEGVVLVPRIPRRIVRTGAYLALKIISPAYKGDDEAFA